MEEVHTKEVHRYVLVCYAAHVVCLLLCSKDQRISKDVSSTPKNELKIVHKVDPEVGGRSQTTLTRRGG